MTIENINKKINAEQSKTVIWCLFALIFLSVISYGYFVRLAVVNIVDRQEMEKEIAVTRSKVLELESEYVKAKSEVTEEIARGRGFVLASSRKFIDKNNKDLPGLSLNLR
jgi:hypothetical protein